MPDRAGSLDLPIGNRVAGAFCSVKPTGGALRDLTGPHGQSEADHRELFQAFITGYRGVLRRDDLDLGNLRQFAGLHAACSLVRITSALGTPGDEDPEWIAELRAVLTDMARSPWKLAVLVADAC